MKQNDKMQKNTRTLDMYTRLCEGKTINKTEEAKNFSVDERSIQRDIDDIRAFLSEQKAKDSSDAREVVYDRTKRGFVMRGAKSSLMTNSEILAVCKILLESRAFSKEEMGGILDKLLAGCVPLKNMKIVSDLVANERYHYVELHHQSYVQDKLWDIGSNIKECNLLEIDYIKATSSNEQIKRIVEPVALIFSEYYFYLNADIVEKNERDEYVHKYDYPAIFRIDRIVNYRATGEKYKLAYANRFEEGEFRKRIQFMYAGQLMRIQLRFTGENPEALLDRLPTAKILSRTEEGYIIEAEVYGKGILMWLLSQGSKVEVLKPKSLREEMERTLKEMLGKYGIYRQKKCRAGLNPVSAFFLPDKD